MKDALAPLGDLFCQGEVKKACSIGVVVDATAPFRNKNNSDYMVRLKVIDQTLNEDSSLGEPNNRHCNVFVFAPKVEQLPRAVEIGTIIYLRRADFSFFRNDFQGKLCSKKFTSWVLYPGDPSRLDCEALATNREDLDKGDPFSLRSSIVELRTFAFNFFRTNTVPVRGPKQGSDFDQIMRVTKCQLVGDRHVLHLTDGKEKFKMYSEAKFEDNEVVKVRGISKIDWGDEPLIRPNDYTWVLRIPDWMKSHKEVGKTFIEGQQEFAVGVRHKELHLYTEVEGKAPLVSLSELSHLKKSGEVFRVKVWVTEVLAKSYSQGIRKLKDKREIKALSEEGEPIYSLPIQVQDHSLLQRQECFLLYLFSFDGCGNQFFETLDPKHYQAERSEQVFAKYKNDLLERTSEQNSIELMVQCLSNQDRTIWRVVRTKLKDFI